MEELRLIVETLQGLGGKVRWVVIVWLGLKFFAPLIVAGTIFSIFFLGYRIGTRAMVGHQFGMQVMELFSGNLYLRTNKAVVLRWLGKQDLPRMLVS